MQHLEEYEFSFNHGKHDLRKILNKFIVKFIPKEKIRHEKKQLQKIEKYNTLKAELTKLLKTEYKDTYFIMSNDGLGDIYYTAGLIKEFKEQNTGKVVFLLKKKSLIDLVKIFPSIDGIIYNKDFSILFSTFDEVQRKMSKTDVNILRYPYRGGKTNRIFKDNYVNLLGINGHKEPEQPLLKNTNYDNAGLEFKNLNINKNKTIIIIPECVMFNYKIISAEFWKKFAKDLEKKGYDVVFNTTNRTYKSFKRTFLPIVDFMAFAKQVKHIFAFRSGICDVFAGINITHQTVIYPHNFDVLWADKSTMDLNYHIYHQKLYDNEFDNLKQIYSLNTNFNRKDIHEIFFNGDEESLNAELFSQL